MVAFQRASEAKNKTVQIAEEATQKVLQAKAEAEAMRIKANALSQNKSLIGYEWVQKWDGKTPLIMGGNNLLSIPPQFLEQGMARLGRFMITQWTEL